MTWKDITIKMYLEIQEILESELDNTEKMLQIANVIYNEDITELPIAEFKKRMASLDFIKDAPPTDKVAKNYTINGQKYELKGDFGYIQANQFIDFQNYTKKKDIIGSISCFFVPSGHKYNDGYDMIKVKEDVGSLPITTANALAFFFKKQYVILLVLSQRYSLKQMKKLGMSKEKIKEMEEHLTNLGIANLVATLYC